MAHERLVTATTKFGPLGMGAMTLLLLDQINAMRVALGLAPATEDDMLAAWETKYAELASDYGVEVDE